jgi:hypothetical protein
MRPGPHNLENEPSYPYTEGMVVFSIRDPYMTSHLANEECKIEAPHGTEACALWSNENLKMSTRTLVHRQWHGDLAAMLAPIVWCEKCGTTDPGPPGKFDLAHRKKRRFIGHQIESDYEEYMMAAKLCRQCHISLDENWNSEGGDNFDAHKIMYEVITDIVNKRTFDVQIA